MQSTVIVVKFLAIASFCIGMFFKCSPVNKLVDKSKVEVIELGKNNCLSAFGLVETIENRYILAKAIDNTNLILDDSLGLDLVPSWLTYTPVSVSKLIPVYNVLVSPVGKYSPSWTSVSHRCIFVDAKQMLDLHQLFYGKFKDSETMQNGGILTEDLLTIFLLHEVGHIAVGDTAAFFPPVNTSSNDGLINVEDNYLKKRESDADHFVALQLLRAVDSSRKKNRVAMRKALELQLDILLSGLFQILIRASEAQKQNLTTDSEKLSHLLMDSSYGHYNMEYRVLNMSVIMNPKGFSDTTLPVFIQQRLRALEILKNNNQ